MGEGEREVGFLGTVNDLRNDEWALRKIDGRYSLWQFVGVRYGLLLSFNGSQPLAEATLGEVIYDNRVLRGQSTIRQIRGVQRKRLLESAVFQMPTAQQSLYTKVAYFRVLCPELLVIFWGGMFCCFSNALIEWAMWFLSSCYSSSPSFMMPEIIHLPPPMPVYCL